jgi:hypothetical protein
METPDRIVKLGIVDAGPVLDALWPKVAPLVEDAMSYAQHRDWQTSEVLEQLRQNKWKLVTVERDGELIGVQIFGWGRDSKGRTYVGIVCCAGRDVDAWMPDMVKLGKTMAELAGAERVEIQGRPGWARVLRGWGLKVHGISASAAVADINLG